ncbi:filamentous hemagglutinin N-terminal domain-containing protein [Polaromonas sp. YR568]|uniref:two-partner secretion domain-containing protein n=1 Tax=Polaromonas sp. YR568 TaxID=1855301 RepID=UPI00398BDAEE
MNRIDPSPETETTSAFRNKSHFALKTLTVSLLLAFGSSVHALPQGGVVAAGSASISGGAASTTITQTSQNAVINWQSFGIAAGQSVQFVQPGASAVALNRVLGADPSSIMGSLSSNGKVFLLNPNGILFGGGASVNVGGLVASTLSISDANFMAGQYTLSNPGDGAILNQGTINAADGGYVALLGRNVSNQGVISARLGTVVLAAGNAMTLDVAGDGLLNISVAQGSVNALIQNGGMISAAGGSVLLTAQGAGNLLQTVVNNTGVIQAQTIASRNGRIMLLGDMQTGTMNVGGTLDASAPNGGNGGFIETSAAHVNVLDGARITTAAASGLTGNWLIDPQDFIIGPGGNISGATLSAQLVTNNITIVTAPGPGNGDIFVNDAVSWTASGTPTSLTLNAARDVNINASVTAVDGNFGVCCGRDINVNAPISATRGSLLLSAGRNLNQNATITVTDGNLSMCAANDVNINSAITLTRGNLDPTRSLGLPLGLTIRADTDGTGPGALGGTVVFSPLAPSVTVTGPNAPASIFYNPVSYTAPTDYSGKFVLTGGATLTQRMLVFPEVSKSYDGSNTAVLTGLKGNPAGVTLVADPGSTATFDTIDPGTGKTVTFTGYRLAGPNADQYALASTCCGPIAGKTTGDITPNALSALAALTAANAANPANGRNFSSFGLAPLASFAFYSQDFLPAVYAASEGELFMPGEQVAVAEPAAMPQPIYVAPRYLPRQPRN